jgi:hypothetical protein
MWDRWQRISLSSGSEQPNRHMYHKRASVENTMSRFAISKNLKWGRDKGILSGLSVTSIRYPHLYLHGVH